jgi:predicted DNA-binding antitoxin AbrB/MazE fold protein
MGTSIKARFSKGLLKPLENLNLKEGEEVTLTIVSSPAPSHPDWLERSAGGWVGLIDAEELKRKIYESRLLATRPESHL